MKKCANQKYQLGLFFELNIKARLAPVVAIAVVVAAAVVVVAAVLRKVRASFTLANFFANTNASIFFARNREF